MSLVGDGRTGFLLLFLGSARCLPSGVLAMSDVWLRVGEVAELLAVSNPTARKIIRREGFSVYRPASRLLVREADVLAYRASRLGSSVEVIESEGD